ncbi:hypothetical protein DMC47_39835 [Nostoc sp. 3335mG]|nr:hypothetical protein DMC47_39835 [Nostoc sp. 3335mG]
MWIRLGVLAVWIAVIFDLREHGTTGSLSRYALYAALLLLQIGLIRPGSNAQNTSLEGIEK